MDWKVKNKTHCEEITWLCRIYRQTLESISKFNKAVGCKVNIYKDVLLYKTNLKIILFTVSENIKIMGINVIRCIRSVHWKQEDILKEINETSGGRDIPGS